MIPAIAVPIPFTTDSIANISVFISANPNVGLKTACSIAKTSVLISANPKVGLLIPSIAVPIPFTTDSIAKISV